MKATLVALARAPSPIRRLALTTKQTNHGFYKGTGSGKVGRHTKYGGFKIEWDRVRTYVVPEVEKEFKLTPFVTMKMEKVAGRYEPGEQPVHGKYFLRRWKAENGFD